MGGMRMAGYPWPQFAVTHLPANPSAGYPISRLSHQSAIPSVG